MGKLIAGMMAMLAALMAALTAAVTQRDKRKAAEDEVEKHEGDKNVKRDIHRNITSVRSDPSERDRVRDKYKRED